MEEVPIHPHAAKLVDKMYQSVGTDRPLSYAEFVHWALYDQDFGYYRRKTQRVGRSNHTDFYTSQSLGPVFGNLVVAAIRRLLETHTHKEVDLKEWTLVEMGYEVDAGWWKEAECPFNKVLRIGPADPVNFSGSCVVFSNELFDAQPFHRLVRVAGQWRELGVKVSHKHLQELLLEHLSPEVRAFKNQLPLEAPDGYQLDLPLASRELIKQLADLPWNGLFLALDYGKSWTQLANDFPQGTARAYYRHKQSSHLLSQPGLQDLTCHLCWDWLIEELVDAGFASAKLESQEAFFVRNSIDCIQTIVTKKAGSFDPIRQTMMHLIHPATMGQQFQVLSGFRS